MNMNCKTRRGRIVILVFLGVAALSWLVMALWNWLMPELFFGAKSIGYLQAVGILVLSKILFGGFRGHCGHGRWSHRRWEEMTPDEREKLQNGMRNWCGRHGNEAVAPPENQRD